MVVRWYSGLPVAKLEMLLAFVREHWTTSYKLQPSIQSRGYQIGKTNIAYPMVLFDTMAWKSLLLATSCCMWLAVNCRLYYVVAPYPNQRPWTSTNYPCTDGFFIVKIHEQVRRSRSAQGPQNVFFSSLCAPYSSILPKKNAVWVMPTWFHKMISLAWFSQSESHCKKFLRHIACLLIIHILLLMCNQGKWETYFKNTAVYC